MHLQMLTHITHTANLRHATSSSEKGKWMMILAALVAGERLLCGVSHLTLYRESDILAAGP